MDSFKTVFRSKSSRHANSQSEPPNPTPSSPCHPKLRRWTTLPRSLPGRSTKESTDGSRSLPRSRKGDPSLSLPSSEDGHFTMNDNKSVILHVSSPVLGPPAAHAIRKRHGAAITQRDYAFGLLALSYILHGNHALLELISVVRGFLQVSRGDRRLTDLVEHMSSLIIELIDANHQLSSEVMAIDFANILSDIKDIDAVNAYEENGYGVLTRAVAILEEKRDYLQIVYPDCFGENGSERKKTFLDIVLDPSVAMLNILSSAANIAPIPFLKAAVDLTLGLFNSAQQTRSNFDDMNSIRVMSREFVLSLVDSCCDLSFIPSESFQRSLNGFLRILKNIHQQCGCISQSSLLHRLLFQQAEKQQVSDLKFKLQGAIDIFQMETQILQHSTVSNIKATVEVINTKLDDEIVDRLPHVFNTHPRKYLPGSRDNVMEQVTKWIETCPSPFFWLHGAVGIGKSTFAHELVYALRDAGRLATFFFFIRGSSHQSDPLRVVKTMAYELASLHPKTKSSIARAIRDPQSTHQPLSSYIRSFILDPCIDFFSQPMTIILDGLDEYEHAQLFLEAFSELIIPRNVKILITSRPEREIHRAISKLPAEACCLETVDGPTIARYFEGRFEEIDMKPSSTQISQLVGLAGGFLAWAATVSSFIGNDMNGKPEDLLDEVLSQGKRGSSEQQLDLLYNTSLSHLFGHFPAKAADNFRRVFGAMYVIQAHLDVTALRDLVETPGIMDAVVTRLLSLQTQSLSAEMNITPVSDHFHLSFLDFVVDPERCTHDHLLIRPRDAHAMLANKCLSLMAKSAPFCNSNDIDFHQLGKALQYATKHWALHVTKTAACGDPIPPEIRVHLEEFLQKHLPVWITLMLQLANRLEAYDKILAAPDIAGRLTCLVIELRQLRSTGNPFPVAKLVPIQEVAVLLAYNSPYLDSYMVNLAQMFREQFWEEGKVSALDLAVLFYRRILELRPFPHAGRSQALGGLANCLWHRYERTGSSCDIDEAILLNEETLTLRPHPHPQRTQTVNNLANALGSRFRRDRSEDDLNMAISLHECALEMRPPLHPNRFQSLRNLAAILWTRFEWTASNEDLNRAISLSREALKLLPPSQLRWIHSHNLMKLAHGLCSSGEQGGSKEDLEESIILHREALQRRIPGHPDRPNSLNGLARALRIGYQQTGSKFHLREAISLHREAIEQSSTSDPLYSHFLSNLSKALWYRYKQTSSLADLEEAISLNYQGISLHQPARGEPSQIYNNLANALHSRFERTGAMDDLNTAISLHYEALKLRPVPSLSRPQSLSNLADLLLCRYEETEVEGDLKEALSLNYEALRLLPAHHLRRSYTLNSLGKALWIRSHTEGDLAEGIGCLRGALALRPAPHPSRPETLDNLAAALQTQFWRADSIEHLCEAVTLLQEAVWLTPQTHIYFKKYTRHLGVALELRKSRQ